MEINYILSIILILLIFLSASLKSNDRFLIILLNATNGIGIIYYVLGGELYTRPNEESLYYLLLILININIAYTLYAIFFKKIGISKYYQAYFRKKINKKIYLLLPIMLFPLYYFIVYYKSFPIYYMIIGSAIGESFRPDVSGAIPHFYTFGVFLSSFTFPYFVQLFTLYRTVYIKVTILSIIIFFAMLIGDKSTLMSIIFYLYLIKQKVSIKKIFVFFVFFVFFYILMKYLYYAELRYDDINALFESIFRRICLIGPSSFGEYINYFILNDGSIPSGFRHIKQFLFYLIYGYKEGGLSVIFPGSFIDIIKLGFGQLIIIQAVFLIILVVRNLIFKMKFNYMGEAIKFLHFYGAILTSQGFISDIFVRWFIPVVVFILIDKVLSIRNKKI